jgi:hypothetical protein
MTAPYKPPAVQVTPEPGSMLEYWVSQRPAAEAARDEGQKKFDEVKAEIEALAVQLATHLNGGRVPERIRVAGNAAAPALTVTWHGNETKFNRAKFEADYPGVYEKYLIPARPYWGTRKA